MFSSSIFGGPAGNNGGGGSAATFDGLTGGSFTLLGPGNPAIPGPTFSLGGFDPTTSTFTSVAPNTSTLTVSFPNNAGSLAGNVTVTSVQDNATGTFAGPITAIGDFTETSGTGALGAAFANGGILDLPASISNCASPCSLTLANLFALPAGNNFTTLVNNGPILTPAAAPPEIPLPPAIYLFGSVLGGGAFWMRRRNRSTTPSMLAEA